MRQGIESYVCYRNLDRHECIHQASRLKAGKGMLLIATDIAYEMMIAPLVDNIINRDFSCTPKRFLSRVRTTARTGPGTAFSFVTCEDIPCSEFTRLSHGRTYGCSHRGTDNARW